MPTVLVLLAEGFEEIEVFTPVDLLRRAGADVTIASLADHRHVTGRNGITVHADAALSEIGEPETVPAAEATIACSPRKRT